MYALQAAGSETPGHQSWEGQQGSLSPETRPWNVAASLPVTTHTVLRVDCTHTLRLGGLYSMLGVSPIRRITSSNSTKNSTADIKEVRDRNPFYWNFFVRFFFVWMLCFSFFRLVRWCSDARIALLKRFKITSNKQLYLNITLWEV